MLFNAIILNCHRQLFEIKMKTDYVILIPSFNSSVKDIKKTLISTPSNANILIVDDGSDISFQDNYNQANIYRSGLQILRLEKNVGIENALRLGVLLTYSTSSLVSCRTNGPFPNDFTYLSYRLLNISKYETFDILNIF
ncbi:glycosyltransferase family 2 protein [Raoultella planticola]|uniref:glycosyltransferase family 2 protein n=1 Tax=Raoultella planticola TaxID=575 RepID=UPI003873889D